MVQLLLGNKMSSHISECCVTVKMSNRSTSHAKPPFCVHSYVLFHTYLGGRLLLGTAVIYFSLSEVRYQQEEQQTTVQEWTIKLLYVVTLVKI